MAKIKKEQIEDLSLKVKISGYWFDTIGNSDINAIEVGNEFEGWVSATRYVVGKVIALPFDVDDNTKVSLIVNNEL